MITFFSGTPGSGKSLHTAKEILTIIRNGHRVIANFPVKLPKRFRKKKDRFIYKQNMDITVKYLQDFAMKHHRKGVEGQTTLIIDECAIMFNAREWDKKGRNEWLVFFQQHRHLGYNVLLIAQNDRMIDRQIRSNFEYEIKHRKANNFGGIGFLFTILHIKLFAAVTYWYGINEKCGIEFFTYRRKYSRIYDSYSLFTEKVSGVSEGETGRQPGGAPPETTEAAEKKACKLTDIQLTGAM